MMEVLQVDREPEAVLSYVKVLLAVDRPRAAREFLQSLPGDFALASASASASDSASTSTSTSSSSLNSPPNGNPNSPAASASAAAWLLILRHYARDPILAQPFLEQHYPRPIPDEAWCALLASVRCPWEYVHGLRHCSLSVQAALLQGCVQGGRMAEAEVVWRRLRENDKPYAQQAVILYLFHTQGPAAVERWVRSLNTQLDEEGREAVWRLLTAKSLHGGQPPGRKTPLLGPSPLPAHSGQLSLPPIASTSVLTPTPLHTPASAPIDTSASVDTPAPIDTSASVDTPASAPIDTSAPLHTAASAPIDTSASIDTPTPIDTPAPIDTPDMQLQPSQPPPDLLSKSEAINLLAVQESISQYPAPTSAYEEMIRMSHPHDKLAVYTHSQQQNVIPSPDMITQICLCQDIPLEDRFQVYLDMPLDKAELLPQLDKITNALLSACATTPNSHNIAVSILLDMHKLGLTVSKLDPVLGITVDKESNTKFVGRQTTRLTRIVTGMMRLAPDPTVAYQLYTRVHALAPTKFSPATYAAVLRSLSKSFAGRITVPLSLFSYIMRDMRHTGHPPTGAIYQALLWHYSHRPATKAGVNTTSTRDLRAVINIHTIIKVDSTLKKVDFSLLNSLMLAYKELGDWENFWKVWDSITMRVRTNKRKDHNPDLHTSLLIAFDAACLVKNSRKVFSLRDTAVLLRIMPEGKLFAPFVTALARSGEPCLAVQELIDDEHETNGDKDRLMREGIIKSLSSEEVAMVKDWVYRNNYQRIWPSDSHLSIAGHQEEIAPIESGSDWPTAVLSEESRTQPLNAAASSSSIVQRTRRLILPPALGTLPAPQWDADITDELENAALMEDNSKHAIYERIRRHDGIVMPTGRSADSLTDEERMGARNLHKNPLQMRPPEKEQLKVSAPMN